MAFRKRTTVGLSRVQKSRKTQRPESFFPPEYDNAAYADARAGTANAAVNHDADDSDGLYMNAARHS